jgi:CheY-like chemotaxis protein
MADYVAKILQMTRLDAGAIVPSRDWNALSEIANATLDRLADRLARHRVIVELAPDLPLVRVDAALIDQALGNLVENAAGHTPADTVIRVPRAARRGRGRRHRSRTMATGSPSAMPERVFAKFEHGIGGARGPGLGLAICRAIVRLHDGRAWAERLPTAARRSISACRSRRRRRCRPKRRKRERDGAARDDPRRRGRARDPAPAHTAFGVEGYRTVESATGRRGTIDAGTHKPDLAIVDLGLPDMEGIDVIRQLRQWSSMPIIVLSARVQEQTKSKRSTPAPTTTSPSRSASASCSRACAPRCGTRCAASRATRASSWERRSSTSSAAPRAAATTRSG